MVGPSATGSLNGTPSSITSAPASAAAKTIFSLAASEGSPAVIYATRPISPASASVPKRRGILRADCSARVATEDAGMAGSDIARKSFHVFVAASRNVQDHSFVFLHFRSASDQFGNGMRRFERRDNPLDARQRSRSFDSVIVRHRCVLCAALIRKPCVLGANRRV